MASQSHEVAQTAARLRRHYNHDTSWDEGWSLGTRLFQARYQFGYLPPPFQEVFAPIAFDHVWSETLVVTGDAFGIEQAGQIDGVHGFVVLAPIPPRALAALVQIGKCVTGGNERRIAFRDEGGTHVEDEFLKKAYLLPYRGRYTHWRPRGAPGPANLRRLYPPAATEVQRSPADEARDPGEADLLGKERP
jgi:hypothetical protein